MTRLQALVLCVLVSGCSSSHPTEPASCASLGGRCSPIDLPCDEGTTWSADGECPGEHSYACCIPDAPEPDAGSEDAGAATPCPDFSCEARCAGVSVCNCYAPGGDVECARRGGRCMDDACVLPDAGADAGVDAGVGLDGGAADAGVDPDGGVTDAGPPADGGPPGAVGVPCGAATCEAGVSFCAACAGDAPEARCLPSSDGAWPFGGAEHCGFPSAFVECDGPEDCPTGEVCTFSGGEWGYGQCWAADEAFAPLACHDDTDCADGARCGEVDPYGYFSPLYPVLGWRPRACGGASAGASAFCDRYDTACGIGAGEEFYAREPCLGHFDGHDAAGQSCLLDLLAEAEAGSVSHCTYAARRGPCG